jgi:gliding motility-associated-like protein
MRLKIYIILVVSLLSFVAKAQDKSNRGKEFWLGYGYNWIFDNETSQNSQELVLYLSTEAPATVTVSVTNTSWSQTVNIPANTVDTSIKIPKTGADDARIFNEGLHNKAVHIVSDTPIVVNAHTYNTMISAATMLMPVETYGYLYYSLNYSQAQSASKPPNPPINTTQNGPAWYSWFYVIATEDNTRLEITPSDTTRNGWLPTQTYTVNLNKGEIYNVMGKLTAGNQDWQASKDMTGSKVVSVVGADGNCHPVALFSGSSGIRLCYYDGGEAMIQQVFPTQAWGTRYLTYHMLNNGSTDINDPFKNFYRIAVADPTTVVKRNGTVLTGLIKNFYYEILDSTGGDYIEADKPILMAQYTPGGNRCYMTSQEAYGDPEMFYLSPLEQGKRDVLFYATRNKYILFNYLNLIVSNAGLSSLRLDGNPFDPLNTKPHPNHPGYSVAVARIMGPASQHRIICDSIFTGTLQGLGFAESYAYNVGTFINNLNNYTQIQNTLNTNGQIDTFTCPKTPFRLTAKLAFPATAIHWKLSQVNGITPNADSIISNPVPIGTEVINGRTYYLYTLQQDFQFAAPGKYSIPISYSATVIENCNQTEYATLNVLVKPGPVADFSISAQQCLSDTVRFTGTTSTQNGLFNYTNHLWNFDDATTQSTINAKKRFATAGNHDVRYRVYADNGCIGDTTKTITITNGTGPQIAFTINGKTCVDSTLTFTSAIPPAANTTYWWDFGDGQTTTSTTNTILHAYAATATNRVVRHTATITGGCSPDTVQQTIPSIFANPAAIAFTTTGDTLCINKPIQFAVASTTGVNNWNWNFGNGTGAQTPPFVYTYSTAGTFNIALTITNTNGCGSPASTSTITVSPNPVLNAGPDKYIAVNSSITLDATLTNAAAYIINWTPAATLNNQSTLNPVSTPPDLNAITYTIQVTNSTSLCTASDKVIITPISKLYIPAAFTPNNDGKNDKWEILGLALYPDAVVTIFNRWGEKIFETKNYISNPWTGFYKGQKQPIGSYVYFIQLNDDLKQTLKGTITIIQ